MTAEKQVLVKHSEGKKHMKNVSEYELQNQLLLILQVQVVRRRK